MIKRVLSAFIGSRTNLVGLAMTVLGGIVGVPAIESGDHRTAAAGAAAAGIGAGFHYLREGVRVAFDRIESMIDCFLRSVEDRIDSRIASAEKRMDEKLARLADR